MLKLCLTLWRQISYFLELFLHRLPGLSWTKKKKTPLDSPHTKCVYDYFGGHGNRSVVWVVLTCSETCWNFLSAITQLNRKARLVDLSWSSADFVFFVLKLLEVQCAYKHRSVAIWIEPTLDLYPHPDTLKLIVYPGSIQGNTVLNIQGVRAFYTLYLP